MLFRSGRAGFWDCSDVTATMLCRGAASGGSGRISFWLMGRRRNGACPERKKGFFEARQTVVERVFEPILFFLFSGKGETDGIFFLLLQKENAWQKKKETGETFRMVSPDPFYRPEPCSGLAAYGSRRIYDRLCRGRCRAQLFATKERYRCGLPLAGTHRPFPAAADRKSTRLNSSHSRKSRMPSSA